MANVSSHGNFMVEALQIIIDGILPLWGQELVSNLYVLLVIFTFTKAVCRICTVHFL